MQLQPNQVGRAGRHGLALVLLSTCTAAIPTRGLGSRSNALRKPLDEPAGQSADIQRDRMRLAGARRQRRECGARSSRSKLGAVARAADRCGRRPGGGSRFLIPGPRCYCDGKNVVCTAPLRSRYLLAAMASIRPTARMKPRGVRIAGPHLWSTSSLSFENFRTEQGENVSLLSY